MSLIFSSFFLSPIRTQLHVTGITSVLFDTYRGLFIVCYIFQVIFNRYGCAYGSGLYLRCTRAKICSDPHNDYLESATEWIYVQLFFSSIFNEDDTSGQRGQSASIHKSSRNNRTLAYNWRRRVYNLENYYRHLEFLWHS